MNWDANLLNTLVSLAIGAFTLVGLIGGVIIAFRKKLRSWKQRAADVLAAAEQLPSLISSQAEAKNQIDAVKAMAQRVQSAVLPNGGGSIPDKLNQMAAEASARGSQLDSLGRKVDSISNTMRATQNADTRLGTFDADEHGRCTYVNRTYLRWTGLSLAEVVGWGWMNAVHPDDRAHVREGWDAAVADSRRYQDKYRMVAADGTVFAVECSAEPIPEGGVPAERWVGNVVRIVEK